MRIYILSILFAAIGLLAGCSSQPTHDPLADWQKAYGEEPNQIIKTDIQDYIQKLPPEQRGYIGTEWFYKNGNGQHAVSIQIFEGNKNASWQHVLFYDKDDKRTNAIRYGHIKYQS